MTIFHVLMYNPREVLTNTLSLAEQLPPEIIAQYYRDLDAAAIKSASGEPTPMDQVDFKSGIIAAIKIMENVLMEWEDDNIPCTKI